MIQGKLNNIIKDTFVVIKDNHPLSGIDTTSFICKIYRPDNTIFDSTNIIISEIDNGYYEIQFIPDMVGNWIVSIFHDEYFPWGKTNTIQIYNNDYDTIYNILKRLIGLSQENYYIDNTSYDTNMNLISARIRIYNDNISVGTNSNILATYILTATYSGQEMLTYKLVRQ